jgi:hypothetical protein
MRAPNSTPATIKDVYNQKLQICLQMHVNTIISPSVRCEALTPLIMNITLFWDRMPNSLVIQY